jgi:hypothetical protein
VTRARIVLPRCSRRFLELFEGYSGTGEAIPMSDDDGGAVAGCLRRQQLPEYIGGVSMQTIYKMIRDGEFPGPTTYARRVPLWSLEILRVWARGEWRAAGPPEPTKGSVIVKAARARKAGKAKAARAGA